MSEPIVAKARFGFKSTIVVDDCPFCHETHYHHMPVGSYHRMPDCFRGIYILDFSEKEVVDETKETSPNS
jgi:hypothetical protein